MATEEPAASASPLTKQRQPTTEEPAASALPLTKQRQSATEEPAASWLAAHQTAPTGNGRTGGS